MTTGDTTTTPAATTTLGTREGSRLQLHLTDQHLPYREWRTLKGPDQQAYFTWRHTHPDSAIITVR